MLTLTEDQRLLMDSARAAVAAHAPIAEYRRLRESQGDGFSRDFWRLAAEMGWSGVLIPEAQGGAGFGVVGAGLAAREMARTLSLSPFLSTAVMAATALGDGGSAAHKETWLPRIAAAETIVAFRLP
jgi:alkylation response protein AidB-like acyl-CoA dehydrogenase